MSFTRVNPNSWAVGDKFTSAQANALDIQLANALDKTSAGDTISGALTLAAAASFTMAPGSKFYTAPNGIQVAGIGGVTVSAGGSIIVNAGAINVNIAGGISSNTPGAILLNGGATDFPAFGATRSKQLVVPCASADLRMFLQSGTFGLSTQYASFPNSVSIANRSINGFQPLAAGYAYAIDLTPYMHQGATLSSATLSAYIVNSHTSLPTYGPGLAILRLNPGYIGLMNPSSVGAASMSTSIASTYALPGSVSAYNSTGTASVTFSANQQNVIDKSSYLYVALVYDEYGAGAIAGNTFNNITLNFTGIADMRFQ